MAEALEMMDSLVKGDSRRKQNWHVHEKSAPNTLATIFGEVHYHRTYYKAIRPKRNAGIYRMNWWESTPTTRWMSP